MEHALSDFARKPGWFTEFQILAELAERQSKMRQRDVAEALEITVQAVSKHVKKLRAEGLIESKGVEYVLTHCGIEKLATYTKSLETQVKKASALTARETLACDSLQTNKFWRGGRPCNEERSSICG